MREDRGADDVVRAMDRIDAVEDRDAEAGREGGLLVAAPTIRYQASGVLGTGAPSPPLSTEPRRRSVTSVEATDRFSSWVIWPIFSSIVIAARSAAARAVGAWAASCQSRPGFGLASAVAVAVAAVAVGPGEGVGAVVLPQAATRMIASDAVIHVRRTGGTGGGEAKIRSPASNSGDRSECKRRRRPCRGQPAASASPTSRVPSAISASDSPP